MKTYENHIEIEGRVPYSTPSNIIDVKNSGTTIRFFTALSSLAEKGYTVLTGDDSIRQRPMQPLLDALNQFGVKCFSTRLNGYPPIIVAGDSLIGGEASILGNVSSQYISSLLISLTKAKRDSRLKILRGKVSEPYIEATKVMLSKFNGIYYEKENEYYIPSKQELIAKEFHVPSDFSSASFMLAAGALAGDVKVIGLDFNLPQADMKILEILKDLGAGLEIGESWVRSYYNGKLKGGTFDLKDSPDLLPIVSILALNCEDKITIKGVKHARYKESDRISSLSSELKKLGADVIEYEDGLSIIPSKLKSCKLDAKKDHRLFMAFSLIGLLIDEGIEIEGKELIKVSYPNFIQDMINLGAKVELD